MNDLDDLLDGINEPRTRVKGSARRFRSALDASEAAELAAPKSMAGKQKRVQFFLPPEQHQYIIRCAKEEGMGVMEFRAWLVDTALQAYDEGLRPELDEIVTRKHVKFQHATSNR
jgi:hypothetical protein